MSEPGEPSRAAEIVGRLRRATALKGGKRTEDTSREETPPRGSGATSDHLPRRRVRKDRKNTRYKGPRCRRDEELGEYHRMLDLAHGRCRVEGLDFAVTMTGVLRAWLEARGLTVR